MPYCRFSDDDFRCDFYAYQGSEGFHLHVAGSRPDWEPPISPYDPASLELTTEEFLRISKEYHKALRAAPRTWIELEGAGEHHRFGTLGELRDAMAQHIRRGFHAPGWLLPSLDRELARDAPTPG